jgi:hypothetical protein
MNYNLCANGVAVVIYRMLMGIADAETRTVLTNGAYILTSVSALQTLTKVPLISLWGTWRDRKEFVLSCIAEACV